jgi:hypothetical protein
VDRSLTQLEQRWGRIVNVSSRSAGPTGQLFGDRRVIEW